MSTPSGGGDEHVVGSPGWLQRVFDTEAREDIFTDAAPTPESALLVLLGGQPAAGKTRAQEMILTTHAGAGLVEITGDDLREYHPDYPYLALEDPLVMPEQTAPVSGGLVRLALEHALEHRYSVLLEGTFRDAGMVTDTATRFAESGYRVEVVAVATPAPVSRLSAELRSLDAGYPMVGRWTPPAAHETALTHSADVLAALEDLPAVTGMQVHSRERLLYENTRTPEGHWQRQPEAASVLRTEQTRLLGPEAAVGWLRRYQAVFALAKDRPGYLNPATAPAYRLLQADAETMIDLAAQTPGAGTVGFTQQQRLRGLHLDRIAPSPSTGRLGRAVRRLTRPRNPESPWQSPRHGPNQPGPPGLGH